MSQVRLCPYTESHAHSLLEAAHESVVEVHPWLPWCHPEYQLSDAQDWIRRQIHEFASASEFQFAIESSEGVYLGGCGLNQINPLHQFANLGYWVRTSQVGQGIATQAVRLLAKWAFSHTALVRLEIVTAVGNNPSQRVAEKAGAVREGLLSKRLLLHGLNQDAFLFSITGDIDDTA